MSNPTIQRAHELARYCSQHGDLNSFLAAEARLRTLDRQGEISASEYDTMKVIAHARAGNTTEARRAFAGLGSLGEAEIEHIKSTLLAAPEASLKAYRAFVDKLMPATVLSTVRVHRKPKHAMYLAVAAVCLVATAVTIVVVRQFQTSTVAEPPSKRTITVPYDTTTRATTMDRVALPTTYDRMVSLTCKVILRLHILHDGKTLKVPYSSGSGFVVSRDGLIVTNRHVVERGERAMENDWVVGWDVVVMFMRDKPLILPGRVAHQSAYVDLATIQVDHQFSEALDFAKTPSPGDRVMAYGFPGAAEDLGESLNQRDAKQREAMLDLKLKDQKEPDLVEWIGVNNIQLVVTGGIVSAIKNTEEGVFLQTDTTISHGNSGGPLIDDQGHVVGMATLGLQGANLCLASRTIFEELSRETGIQWPKEW